MTPTDFPEANVTYGPPNDLAESQCAKIRAWNGSATRGSCDGYKMVVVAWQPSAEELAALQAGAPVFLSVMGGLPPHFLTTDFQSARNPV
jgi:hypothetical protein